MKPPGFSGSGSAWTASSWSRASGGSMVTSGSLRQSSRCAMSAGSAASAASSTASRKDMRNAVLFERDQADRLLARDIAEPLDDARRRAGRSGRCFTTSTETSSPSFAPFAALGGDGQLLAAPVDRDDARLAVALAEDAERRLRLPLQELDDARGEAAGLLVGREAGEHAVADARRARLAARAPSARTR